MANKDQLKALLDSYFHEDKERFITIALQVAATAAKKGQNNLARELKEIIDKGREQLENSNKNKVVQLKSIKGEALNLLSVDYPEIGLRDVVFANELDIKLRKIIKEQLQRNRLREFSLEPVTKLLLVGPPGTGKTLTAKILSSELKIPLFTVQFENLISKYMGESAAKLKVIFNEIQKTRGVYLFDEFDAIGAKRTKDNDVGEVRRILNSFLQMFEALDSDSIVIAATNHPELLDKALFRRFDLVIEYKNPDIDVVENLLKGRLYSFIKNNIDWRSLAEEAKGLNHAEIVRSCNEIAKEIILNDNFFVDVKNLSKFFKV